MPMVNLDTAGTATVELTIIEQPEGNLERSSHIQIPGCFLKNDRNLQRFVEKFIDDSADSNKFDPGNSKYIFYSPVSDFRGVVTEAILSYEQISNKWETSELQRKTKTCTVEKPLVITFDGHFFLCCDSKDLNKSKFLEKYSKEVRINQTLDSSKRFYGLGMEDYYLLFVPFSMIGQTHNDIYETNDRRVFNKLEEAGPLLLNDNKTIVGCYRKSDGNCRIKINVFGKSQGDPAPDFSPTGLTERGQTPTLPLPGPKERDRAPDLPPPGLTERDRAPDLLLRSPPEDNRQLDQKVLFLYDQLWFYTISYLHDYITNGSVTLDDLKDHFHGFLSKLTENEREEIDTVTKLVKTLEDLGVIGANDVEILKMLAENLQLRELKEKVEEFEAECSGDDTRGNAGCQELVCWVGVQNLATISSTKAADKLVEYLQLDQSSMADPPTADIQQKCRGFCQQLKKMGRKDIIKKLRETLPSGMTGPLLDDDTLYQELEFKTRRDLTRALCGNDLWKYLASVLKVSGDHIGYFERQLNPARAMLEDDINRNLKVKKLYDLLVMCDAGALADMYL